MADTNKKEWVKPWEATKKAAKKTKDDAETPSPEPQETEAPEPSENFDTTSETFERRLATVLEGVSDEEWESQSRTRDFESELLEKGFWYSSNGANDVGDSYTLNCSSPFEEPDGDWRNDTHSGETCEVTAHRDGLVSWQWIWEGHGYNEFLRFDDSNEFWRFYSDLMEHGIKGVDYENYACG